MSTPPFPESSQFSTCDLCDAHASDASAALRVLPNLYIHYGGQRAFSGPAVTLRCPLDNSRVREAVQEAGLGRVLVVDGLACVDRALVGGNLAMAAAKNGWAGMLVCAAVRDAAELRTACIGIAALALCPLRTEKRGQGERDVPLQIHGIAIQPGEWIYADEDGVLVAARELV